MQTLIVIIIYITLLLLFGSSKLKANWLIFIAFMAGYYANEISTHIINWIK